MEEPSGDSTDGVPEILFRGIHHWLTTQGLPHRQRKTCEFPHANPHGTRTIERGAGPLKREPAEGLVEGSGRRRNQRSLFGGKLDANLFAMQTPDGPGDLEHLAVRARGVLNEGDFVGQEHQGLGFQDSLAKARLHNQR